MQVDGDTLDFRSDTASETEQPNDLLGPLDEQEELDLTGGSMGDEEADDPLQLDMFAEIAMELEQDGIEDSSIGRQRRSHFTMSPQKKRTAFVNVDEEEWAVRDFAGLRNIDPIQHELSARRFHFAAPQGDAVQVDWESQSPAHWRASLTPRVRFGSRLDASVAATTPRSILRSPQPDGSPRSNDHGKPTASALRSQHVNPSPRSPSSLPRHMILPLRSDSSTHTAMPRVSLNPAAELISYRMERTPSVSKQSAAADDEAEEDELLEDADLQDLLPDIPQLRGDVPQSSNEPRTPLDANIADLLPDLPHAKHGEEPGVVDEMDPIQGLGMDFFVPEGLPALAVRAIPTVSDPVIDLNHALPIGTLPVSANGIDSLYQGNVAPPTSQRAIVSSRPRNSRETQEFATPDPREDQEDWQSLSDLTAQGLPRRTTWRTANAAAPSIKQSPGSPDLLRPDVPRVIHRGPRRAREMTGEDLYLVDADGTPLESDPNYIIPRNHVAKRSRIHGQVEGQSTSYSRLSGRRKWTQAEEILLYRTIQKVPLSGEYPLRVVWFLHGEYGTLSHDLEQFNPQHMKDKMRVIVNARANNRRPVTGRARFFLPGNHPDKLAFNEEMNELRFRGKSVFPTMASEKDELDSDEDKAEEEDYDDLDELVSEVEAEHASPLPKRRKRTRAASKAAPNGHVETEQASPSPKRVKWTRAGSSAVASGHVEAEQASTSGRRRKRSRAGTFVAADSHFISSQAINKTPAKVRMHILYRERQLTWLQPVGESPAKPRTSSGRLEKEFVQLRQDRERVSPGPARRSTRSIKANDRASRYAARKLAAVRAEAEEEDVSEEPVGTKSDRKGRLKAQVNGDGPEVGHPGQQGVARLSLPQPLFIPVEDDDEVAGEDHLDGKGEEALGLIHGIGEDDGEDVVRREMVKRRVLGIGECFLRES